MCVEKLALSSSHSHSFFSSSYFCPYLLILPYTYYLLSPECHVVCRCFLSHSFFSILPLFPPLSLFLPSPSVHFPSLNSSWPSSLYRLSACLSVCPNGKWRIQSPFATFVHKLRLVRKKERNTCSLSLLALFACDAVSAAAAATCVSACAI